MNIEWTFEIHFDVYYINVTKKCSQFKDTNLLKQIDYNNVSSKCVRILFVAQKWNEFICTLLKYEYIHIHEHTVGYS